MKQIDRENLKQKNERILSLLADLHSTLDLYCESNIDKIITSKN